MEKLLFKTLNSILTSIEFQLYLNITFIADKGPLMLTMSAYIFFIRRNFPEREIVEGISSFVVGI